MQKRGSLQLSYEVLIEAILVAIVIISFSYYAASLKDDTLLDQLYISKDIALLADTIQASPNDMFYTYTEPNADISKFDYSFTLNAVNVINKGVYEVFYPFYNNQHIKKNYQQLAKPSQIYFLNTKDELYIDFVKYPLKKGIICPEAEKLPRVSIVIDAGDGNIGLLNAQNNIEEREIAWKSANALYNAPYLNFGSKQLTRNSLIPEEGFDIDDRLSKINENTNLVIMLALDEQPAAKNIVKAYVPYNNTKSRRMACTLLNQLYEDYPSLTAVKIIPSDETLLNKNKEGMAVKLALGNIAYANNPLYSDMNKLAISISKGADNYYK